MTPPRPFPPRVWTDHCSGKVSDVAPAPQLGKPGTITLILGTDFAGVNRPPAPSTGKSSHGKHGKSSSGSSSSSGGNLGSSGFVQARNAGTSICSGLPKSNPNSGSPP
jgi:hypothetical protein